MFEDCSTKPVQPQPFCLVYKLFLILWFIGIFSVSGLCFLPLALFVLTTLLSGYWTPCSLLDFWIIFGLWIFGLVENCALPVKSVLFWPVQVDLGSLLRPETCVRKLLPFSVRCLVFPTHLQELRGGHHWVLPMWDPLPCWDHSLSLLLSSHRTCSLGSFLLSLCYIFLKKSSGY